MKSRIQFDLDYSNSPIIAVNVSHDTADLRDKVVNRFFEEFAHSSTLCKIECVGGSGGPDGSATQWEIRPIAGKQPYPLKPFKLDHTMVSKGFLAEILSLLMTLPGAHEDHAIDNITAALFPLIYGGPVGDPGTIGNPLQGAVQSCLKYGDDEKNL